MTRLGLVLTMSWALAGQARAELVTYGFTVSGGVGVAYGQNLAELGLTPGMPMSGTVSYDPAAANERAPDGTLISTSPGRMTLQAGGHTFASIPSTPVRIELHPSQPPGVTGLPFPEWLGLTATPADPGLFGGPAGRSFLSLTFYPSLGQAGIGRLPGDLIRYGGGYGQVELFYAGPHFEPFNPAVYEQGFVSGMTRLTETAPEPGSLTLAAVGAALALWRRRWSASPG
jgi:hypothetical protein